MFLIDGHLDLAFNALFHRRDLTLPVQALRRRESGPRSTSGHPDSLERRAGPPLQDPGVATVALPQMRKGGIGVAAATVMCRVSPPGDVLGNAVRTRECAHAVGESHVAYYEALEREGQVRILRTATDLRECADAWRGAPGGHPGGESPLIGLILTMESADPILDPEHVHHWRERGVWSVGITHFGANTWGRGTASRGGLYAEAFDLMREMCSAGMIMDLSHSTDMGFEQIMDSWDGPIWASHSNCRALVPGERQLSDDMIRRIAERNGVVGCACCEPMLNPGWDWDNVGWLGQSANHGLPRATATMESVVDHICHICEVTGSADHAAIGSDLDGGFGRELSPVDMDTIADLSGLPELLRNREYSEDDIGRIAHGNLLRLFGAAMEACHG